MIEAVVAEPAKCDDVFLDTEPTLRAGDIMSLGQASDAAAQNTPPAVALVDFFFD
jgi:hypothetical protein